MSAFHPRIRDAFLATDQRAGPPTITDYPGGAWVASADRNGVRIDVTRTAEGLVFIRYNSPEGAGTSTINADGSITTPFGADGPHGAGYNAAKALAERVRRIYNTPSQIFSPTVPMA